MNNKTAKLLRKWCAMKGLQYRRAKKMWHRRAENDKAEIRQNLKVELAAARSSQ